MVATKASLLIWPIIVPPNYNQFDCVWYHLPISYGTRWQSYISNSTISFKSHDARPFHGCFNVGCPIPNCLWYCMILCIHLFGIIYHTLKSYWTCELLWIQHNFARPGCSKPPFYMAFQATLHGSLPQNGPLHLQNLFLSHHAGSHQVPYEKNARIIYIIELDDGKIYRKTLYLMVKTMVSCRFSLKPIQWIYIYIYMYIAI